MSPAAQSAGTGTAAPATFGAKLMGIVIAAAIALGGLYAVLSVYGPDPGERDGGVHALSNSAVGFSGVMRLAAATGQRAAPGRDPRLLPEGGLLILTPGPNTDPADLKALVDMRVAQPGAAPVLIVLPKWQTQPLPEQRGWVAKVGGLPALSVTAGLTKLLNLQVGVAVGARECCIVPVSGDEPAFMVPDALKAVAGQGLVPALVYRGSTVMAWSEELDTYVLADPDLLNNRGMKDPVNARAALRLLRELGNDGPLTFDVTLQGFDRSRNFFRLAFEPPFLGLTLTLLVAAALAGLQAAIRFGAPRGEVRAIAFGKRALVDNAAELIRSAKREPAMTARYAALTLETAAAIRGAPPRLQGAELAAWLDRRRSGDGAAFAALDEAAHAARGRDDSLAAARALHAWKEDVTHDG